MSVPFPKLLPVLLAWNEISCKFEFISDIYSIYLALIFMIILLFGTGLSRILSNRLETGAVKASGEINSPRFKKVLPPILLVF